MFEQLGNDQGAAAGPPEAQREAPPPINPLLREFVMQLGATNPLEAAASAANLATATTVQNHIRNLDNSAWRTRESATQNLVRLGMVAAPHLAEALTNRRNGEMSLEQTRRCEQALERILSNQSLQQLISHLNDSRTPDYLQSCIRSHVLSRLPRQEMFNNFKAR